MLRHFYVTENLVKFFNLLYIPNHLQKSAKVAILISAKYHCENIEEKHELCFPVIL